MYTYGEREDGDYLILDNDVPMSANEVVVRLRQLETENEQLLQAVALEASDETKC